VFVKDGSGPKIRVNTPGTYGAGGGIDGQTLVYYQSRGRTYAGNIRMFNLLTHQRSNFPAKVSTRFDEYFPTISGDWVLFTRYISTKQATKVLLYNTQTHELRTLATARGFNNNRFVYSGQVNGDYAAWGRVGDQGADVYVYRISTNVSTIVPPTEVFQQYNPSVARDGTIYFLRSGSDTCGGQPSLVRYIAGEDPELEDTYLHKFPRRIDVTSTFVDEEPDGSLQLFFGEANCKQGSEDIYKVIDSHSVSVSKGGSGTGTVTSQPAGINCGTACQSIFHGGVRVTFTATPDPGSVFSGWSEFCGTDPVCGPIDIEFDVALTATFDPSP
jgi:hypothetical protein